MTQWKKGTGLVAVDHDLVPEGTTVAAAGTLIGGTDANALGWIVQGALPYGSAEFLLVVTASDTDTIDTLEVYIDTAVDTDAWINIVRFPAVAGDASLPKKYVALINPPAQVPTAPVDASADLSTNTVRHFLGSKYRVRTVMTDADADGTFTFGVHMILKP